MFIEEILKYNSIAIVGLAKNAGKTECFPVFFTFRRI